LSFLTVFINKSNFCIGIYSSGLNDSSSDDEDEKLTSSQIEYKIALEERKFLVANRKLQAIRLVDYLFEKVKLAESLKVNRNMIRS